MALYIQSDIILEDILNIEGNENTLHIEHQVEEAKKGIRTIINGANFEAKYIVEPGGEIRYSCSAGNESEKAQKHGFGITF